MGLKHFGTTADYQRALGKVLSEGVPEKHLELLKAHCLAPRRTRTWRQLAESVGYANFNAVNVQVRHTREACRC
jgi:hypothetical protein